LLASVSIEDMLRDSEEELPVSVPPSLVALERAPLTRKLTI
jgi:hypothetical protein